VFVFDASDLPAPVYLPLDEIMSAKRSNGGIVLSRNRPA